MRPEEKQMRESVQAAADEMADQLVEWQAKHPRFTLSELEEVMLELRDKLGQEIATVALGTHPDQVPVPGPQCPECEAEMQYKELVTLQHTTRLGPLEPERGYYYCTHCKRGFFPPV